MITQLFVFTGIMDDTIPNLMIQACSEFGFEVLQVYDAHRSFVSVIARIERTC